MSTGCFSPALPGPVEGGAPQTNKLCGTRLSHLVHGPLLHVHTRWEGVITVSPQIVSDLREEILRLRFPHRVQSKEPTPKVKRKGLGGTGGGSSPSKSPPTLGPQQALSDRPCLVVLHKPLDKLLIRLVERVRTGQERELSISRGQLGIALVAQV